MAKHNVKHPYERILYYSEITKYWYMLQYEQFQKYWAKLKKPYEKD